MLDIKKKRRRRRPQRKNRPKKPNVFYATPRRAWGRRNRLKLLGVKAELTLQQWKDILKLWDNKCAYCDVELVYSRRYVSNRATEEHVIPTSDPRCTDTPDNIVPACADCNSSKKNRDLREWLDDDERYERVMRKLGGK